MRKLSIKDAFTLARIIKKQTSKRKLQTLQIVSLLKITAKMKQSTPKRSVLNL